jgi:DNA-binding MarR family transcriptional regulator
MDSSVCRRWEYHYRSEQFCRVITCLRNRSSHAKIPTVSRRNEQSGRSRRERLRVPGAAYLLSQVGAHSSRRWHERLAPIGLDSRSVLVLRHVAAEEGRTQASLAASLAVPPSRVVAIVDGLEQRGVVERRANPTDRRAHALWLTSKGRTLLAEVLAISSAHEADICAGLSQSRRRQLIELLSVIAAEQGLASGGHPGLSEPDARERAG